MENNHNALFITPPNSLKANGGVTEGGQLCSREFFDLLVSVGFNISIFNVDYTKNLLKRIRIKIGIANYEFIDELKYKNSLIEKIVKQNIKWVFINMASLLRLARPLKEHFGDKINIYLLSHGNDSGDYLHLQTKPIKSRNYFRKQLNIFRLGKLIFTESLYRNNWLDGVLAVSETERQIENWFGAKKAIFVPRIITNNPIALKPHSKRIGFVGRLDHPPNYQGFCILLDELIKKQSLNINLRFVGAPVDWGKKIASKYSFVEYIGILSDSELLEEVKTWRLFLNPVFWYSTGVTTKLGWALSLGLPIVSTPAGNRGYVWNKGIILTAANPYEMASIIELYLTNDELYNNYINQLNDVRNNSISKEEITQFIKQQLNIT